MEKFTLTDPLLDQAHEIAQQIEARLSAEDGYPVGELYRAYQAYGAEAAGVSPRHLRRENWRKVAQRLISAAKATGWPTNGWVNP